MQGLKLNFDQASVTALKQQYEKIITDLENRKINISFNTNTNVVTNMKQQLTELVNQASNIDIGKNVKVDSMSTKIAQVQNKINDLRKSANSINWKDNDLGLDINLEDSISDVDTAIKKIQNLGNVKSAVAKNFTYDKETKQLQSFNVELEKTNGLINTIKYENQSVGPNTIPAFQVTNISGNDANAKLIASQEKQLATLQKQYQTALNSLNSFVNKYKQKEDELWERGVAPLDGLYALDDALNKLSVDSDKIDYDNITNAYEKLIEQEKQEITARKELDKAINKTMQAREAEEAKLDAKQTQAQNKAFEDNYNTIQKLQSAFEKYFDTLQNSTKYSGLFNSKDIQDFQQRIQQLSPNAEDLDVQINKLNSDLQKFKNVLQEASRVSSLGTKMSDVGDSNLFSKSNADIKDYIENLYEADVKVTKLYRDAETGAVKATVQTEKNNDIIREETVIMDKATQAVYKHGDAIKESTAHTMTFGDKLKVALGGITIWGIATNAVYGFVHQITDAITYVNDLNKSITNIQMITDMSKEKASQLTDQYRELAQQMGQNDTDFLKGAEENLRAGLSDEDTSTMLKQTAIGASIAGISNEDMAENLLAMKDAYGLAAGEIGSLVDKISTLDNKSSTSFNGIIEGMKRSAASAQQAGVQYDKLAAYITTVESATHRSPSSVGESFKSIFTRMTSVAAGQKDTDGIGINDVEKVLSKQNISLRETTGQWRNMSNVIDEIGKKWKTFDGVTQSQISTAMAGRALPEYVVIHMYEVSHIGEKPNM